jgi:hypothetical protein
MGESRLVIDLKKKNLAEELSKKRQNKIKIQRLKEDIERHKKWEYIRKKARRNRRKRWEKRNLK